MADDELDLPGNPDQWVWDLAIQQTGRIQHFFESRQLPQSVKTFAMVSKHLGKSAARLERLAEAEAAAGHRLTALEYYVDAAGTYSKAQHNVFRIDTEKQYLHDATLRCYDAARRLSRTTVERIETPFDGNRLAGYLHLAPTDGPAPLVFFLPGIDMTKESIPPHEAGNWATRRDMHMFVLDGPGQGESNLTGLRLSADNYERAVSAALSQVMAHDEVDASRVYLYGMSFASYWAVRAAAMEPAFGAAVFQWASVANMHYLFDGNVSPRYKQVLAFVTGLRGSELDGFISGMSTRAHAPKVSCPTLTTVGEFDQRTPLEDAYAFFDSLGSPGEMWVFADQHHMLSVRGKSNPLATALDSHALAMDWLADRAQGKPLARPGEVTYLEPQGVSPNDPSASAKRHWFE